MLKEILSGTFRMRYEFLTSTEHALFDAAFDLHEDLHELSFPPALRRSRESFARAFSDPDFECIAFRESQAVMGYATRWFLPDAVYLESIVVAPEFRGLGLGRQHLREIVATSRKPVAALVADELPDALAFFLKNGFHLNDTDAVVPPCLPGAGKGRFALVTSPRLWDEKEKATVLREIARKICPGTQAQESELSSPDADAARP